MCFLTRASLTGLHWSPVSFIGVAPTVTGRTEFIRLKRWKIQFKTVGTYFVAAMSRGSRSQWLGCKRFLCTSITWWGWHPYPTGVFIDLPLYCWSPGTVSTRKAGRDPDGEEESDDLALL